jgi:DNA-binding SARP family transcriptional activator
MNAGLLQALWRVNVSHLAITLFGGLRAELNGKPLTTFGTDKNRALLAYLALKSERPHRREALANLLWPEHPQSGARNSLRQALYKLRQILAPELEIEPYLLVTPDQLQFNPASDHWIDVAEFKSHIATCLSHHSSGRSLHEDCLGSLQRAIELYQGEMLAGFTLPRCEQFTDWQVISQEVCHRQALAALTLLADYFEANLAYDQLIACTQKKIELEPWRESAYRRQMWALAMSGQRERALQRYKNLEEILRREIGVPPTEGIRRLYEQIRNGDLPGSRFVPGTISVTMTPAYELPAAGSVPFAGRQPELAQLDCYLRDSLAGQGRVAFVSGEAGSGKTALLNEFARRAVIAHDDLLVAGGTCSTYNGLGDPFQPFREVLESLTGIRAVPYAGPTISQELARRLKVARPVLIETLFEAGPGLVGTLLSAQDLLRWAKETAGWEPAAAARLETLAVHLVSGQKATTRLDPKMAAASCEPFYLMQTSLYEQVTRLLQAISFRFPVLILLDDLQWLDSASASLLFHLGGHLAGGRILLLGAYRPEDVISAPGQTRHPLAAALNEFQRRFGETQVDLSCADGRAFVLAYLNSQPNHFDEAFRETLYQYTRGNALFTVELLHDMQARGEVVQDNTGRWVQGSPIDWEQLPVRVEAVFAERIGRLDRQCLALLTAASTQGEVFSTGVLSQVLGISEEKVITSLSGPLCKQHLLVSPLSLAEKDDDHQARYQFRCLLLQKYLYQSLDDVERKRLRQATAKALGISFSSAIVD